MIRYTAIAVLALSMFSACEDPVPAPTVNIFASVDGYQVAFSADATNTDTYAWDFGNGETSTEQNPVYSYPQSGTYTATLTVTGEGGTATETVEVTIAASELEMLTGGPGMADGKTWVFSPTSSTGDGIFKCTADLEFEDPIPDGILGLIGLGTEYEDEFTFKHDLSYSHDVKNDSAITNVIFSMVNQIPSRPSGEDVIVLAPFTPEAATFTYTEDIDLTLTCVDKDDDEVVSDLTWSNVTVLEIEGGTEFVGIRDFVKQYMILDISVDKMQIGFFASTSQGSNMMLPKHMLVMTMIPKQ